jgi:rhodanese-related sulfurtransferase
VSAYRSVSPAEAQALVDGGTVHVLDVRTPEEYDRLGHIPGAWLLPVDLMASAPAVLPTDGRPVLVYCEHGVRSVAACDWLARAGIEPLVNLSGGLSRWTGPREFGPGVIRGPSRWLLDNADLIPRGARVLDVAAGRGRHALLLAAAGLTVTAVDRDAEAMARLAGTASRLDLVVRTEVRDLEASGKVDLGDGVFELVVVFNFLHRPLLPAIVRAVAPGGVLLYETFTMAQAARGRPTNPAFLLAPGELPALVAPLDVVRQREGDYDGRSLASVAAMRSTAR